jgi:hypothetical protein
MMDVDITAATSITVGGAAFMVPETAVGASFMYIFDSGSSGTSAKAYIQTSVDGGTTWQDVSSFAGTTSDLNKVSSVSAMMAHTHATPTDGSLTDNTDTDGWFGSQWRVKYVTTGTYVGANLKVYAKFHSNG